MDAPGTGDVKALGTAHVGLPDVAFTGANYGSDRDRTTVAVADPTDEASYVPDLAAAGFYFFIW